MSLSIDTKKQSIEIRIPLYTSHLLILDIIIWCVGHMKCEVDWQTWKGQKYHS